MGKGSASPMVLRCEKQHCVSSPIPQGVQSTKMKENPNAKNVSLEKSSQNIHVVLRASYFVVIKALWLGYCWIVKSFTSCGFFTKKALAVFFNISISKALVIFQ